jgi:hypothetical protein
MWRPSEQAFASPLSRGHPTPHSITPLRDRGLPHHHVPDCALRHRAGRARIRPPRQSVDDDRLLHALSRRSPRGISTRLSLRLLPLAPPSLSATPYTMEYTAEYLRRVDSQSSATDTHLRVHPPASDVPNLFGVPAVTGISTGQYPTVLVIAEHGATMCIYVASPPAIAGALTHLPSPHQLYSLLPNSNSSQFHHNV